MKRQLKAEQQQQQQEAARAARIQTPSQAESLGRSLPLHRAARAGDADRVAMLLESGRHDPSALDEQGRTPYALSADKAVRDAFRRYMAQQPNTWDYTKSGIPSALTEDMEAAQTAKKVLPQISFDLSLVIRTSVAFLISFMCFHRPRGRPSSKPRIRTARRQMRRRRRWPQRQQRRQRRTKSPRQLPRRPPCLRGLYSPLLLILPLGLFLGVKWCFVCRSAGWAT